MCMSSSRYKFTLLYQHSVTDALLVAVRHVGAHQVGTSIASPYKSFHFPDSGLDYRTVLIFISIYFEWLDTENQQFYFFYHVSMGNERVYNDQSMEFFSFFSENALSLS